MKSKPQVVFHSQIVYIFSQFQANELIRDLRSRIDCHFEGGGWIGPDSPGAGASSTPVLASKRVDKRGPPYVRPSPAASKRRFKTEPPEETVDLDDTGGGGFMDDDDYGGSGDPSLDAEPDAGSITNTKQDPGTFSKIQIKSTLFLSRGYDTKKNAGEIQGFYENTHEKSSETSPHMI